MPQYMAIRYEVQYKFSENILKFPLASSFRMTDTFGMEATP